MTNHQGAMTNKYLSIPLGRANLERLWEKAHAALGTGKPDPDDVIAEFLRLEERGKDDAVVALFGGYLNKLLFPWMAPEDCGVSRFKRACDLDPKNETYKLILADAEAAWDAKRGKPRKKPEEPPPAEKGRGRGRGRPPAGEAPAPEFAAGAEEE
ncbi:MAG: hypothetical protein HY719_08485 [Planctomycetes bacterium]|nr:hypothetical protein [Planctomycetota bacterium]